MNTDKKEYLNSEEVAELFGVAEQTIRDWAISGKLTAIKIGARWFFPKDRYIRKQDVLIKCATCLKTVTSAADFKDNLSRKEFRISGMCQECQDKTFTGANL